MSRTGRLSPLDASFLYHERAHRRLHVGCVALLDGRIPFDAFVAAMEERLGPIPLYRRRPVRPFLDLDWPRWEEDPRFEMRRHLRHVAVPAPGGEEELHELVDTLFATPLAPDRPLWETYLIDGLAGGRSALLCKVHHAMIDGVSGAQLLEVMADPTSATATNRHPARPAPAQSSRPAVFSPATWLGHARDAMQMMSTLATLVREPGSTLPSNAPISDARRIVWASLSLDDVLVARGAAGCKVNDVVLAIVTGALRRWLQGRGIRPDGLRVRTLVPVSVRGTDEHLALGNLVTAMIARLPVDAADPLLRLRRIADEMRVLKEQGQARATGLALQLLGNLPAPVNALLARLMPATSPLNTIVTNVPGPREARTMVGRSITEVHPIVPLFDGMGIEFAVMSYADRLSICVAADPHLVPDAADLAAHLHGAAAELHAALEVGAPVAAAAPSTAPRVAALMSSRVVTLRPDDTLAQARALMQSHRIRHLPVTTGDGRLVGLVTHRDVLAAAPSSLEMRAEQYRMRILGHARVAETMETHLSVALAGDAAADAGERMIRQKIGCLPVVEPDGVLKGILTEEDFLRWATARMAPGTEAVRASA